MDKKQKIISLVGIVAIALVIVAYLLFSDTTLCKSINISFIGNSENLLINKKNIKKIVLNEYPNLIGAPIGDINLSDIEKKIETHPAVKNAEVYKKVNGVLTVEIEQRIPIVRVMPVNGKDFYIGSEGSLMPISNIGCARVIVANGNVKFNYKNNKLTINDTTVTKKIRDIYEISKEISKDKFITAQTQQIYVKGNGEYELVPTVGNQIVLLGDISSYKDKLRYLKYFYINVLKKEGWRKYKYISLKYKSQIVCTLSDIK